MEGVCLWLQDCKLHLLRWKFLPKLVTLLHALACLLGASEHQDRYVREMGPEVVKAGPGAQKGEGGMAQDMFLAQGLMH